MNKYISSALFYLFSGCGMQQVSNQFFHVTHLLTSFPACFSMQASLKIIGLVAIFRSRLVCFVTYDRQIDFIVKGPLGIAMIGGIIDEKGITVVDHSRRVTYRWDYQRIKKDYAFVCSYAFIQSLLLGRVCSPIENSVPLEPLPFDLSYSYDELTRKVVAVQLVDKRQNHAVRFFYQYKMAEGHPCLSGIKLDFSFRDKGKFYKGKANLRGLRFKKMKKISFKLKIPASYRQERG